jgi:hypothetical protein
MLVIRAEGIALTINVARWVARNVVKGNLQNRRKKFCGALLLVVLRVFLAGFLNGVDEGFKLIEE